ncbi:zinc finger protein ZF(C2H2)-70 [Ciona intestinalis]
MAFRRKNTKPIRVPEPLLPYEAMQDGLTSPGILHPGLNDPCSPQDIHVPGFHTTAGPAMKHEAFHHPSLNMLRAAALFPNYNGQHFPSTLSSPCLPEADNMYMNQSHMMHASNEQHMQGCGMPWQVSLSLGNSSLDPPTMVAPSNHKWQSDPTSSSHMSQQHHINIPSPHTQLNHVKWEMSPTQGNLQLTEQPVKTTSDATPVTSVLPTNGHGQDLTLSPPSGGKTPGPKKSRKIRFKYQDKQNADVKYKCETCQYCTNRSDHYKRHLITHSEDKPLKCGTCGYSTGRSDHYRDLKPLKRPPRAKLPIQTSIHQQAVQKLSGSGSINPNCSRHAVSPTHASALPPKRFQCDMCGYATDRSSHYNRHTRTHSEERPFSCDKCGKRFKIDTYLKKHRCCMRPLPTNNTTMPNCQPNGSTVHQTHQNEDTLKNPMLSPRLDPQGPMCMGCGAWLQNRNDFSNHICQPHPVLGAL